MVAAIVPIKQLKTAKGRLSGLLTPRQRSQLCFAMLRDVLDSLKSSRLVRDIYIITPDSSLEKRLDSYHRTVTVLKETKQSTLNGAVTYAEEFFSGNGVSHLLIIPGDVPLITAAELDDLVISGLETGMTLVPDRMLQGTNLLMLHLPTPICPCYGPGSFQKHRCQAEKKGVSCRVRTSFRLSCDIDVPEDLEILMQFGKGTAAYQTAEDFGLSQRLWSCRQISS